MALTAIQAAKVNAANPVNQDVDLGTRVREAEFYSPVIMTAAITADAHTTAVSFDAAPCAFEIVEVIVQSRATSTGGTATLRTGTTAITDAIIMATDAAITRAGTVDDDHSTVAAGDVLNVITHGAGDKGLVTIIGKRA